MRVKADFAYAELLGVHTKRAARAAHGGGVRGWLFRPNLCAGACSGSSRGRAGFRFEPVFALEKSSRERLLRSRHANGGSGNGLDDVAA
ncbi:MAG: hypothetical protein BLITH_1153 [Brockia lithotrophica]|uniref:Uncharacterized protein n=1 Tax=Brockia lithotrophica TaxID=933949 RepID=A0A2T5G7L5_9BACL|nr:MAG: hypothetical protein BLITH_1153 [Brockia lithotrophica]